MTLCLESMKFYDFFRSVVIHFVSSSSLISLSAMRMIVLCLSSGGAAKSYPYSLRYRLIAMSAVRLFASLYG